MCKPAERFSRKGRRKVHWQMFTLFVVLAVLSGCQASHGTEVMSIEEKSCAEIGAVLKEFGINGITEEITQELEQSLSHLPPDILLSKTATLLMSLEDDPAANGVYSFDMEVPCEDTMYTEFLRGVSALSKGELVFENIEEDTSAVNWEEGTGSRTVHFDWQSKSYTLEAQMQYDWFDIEVANQLNEILLASGSEKRLYFTTDGYQSCIVFYCTPEWAEAFAAATELPLTDCVEM